MKSTAPRANGFLLAYVGMAASTLIIGLSFVFVKIALSVSSPIDVLAHRFSIAAVTMILFYIAGSIPCPHTEHRGLVRLLVLSVPYPLLFFLLQAVGLQHTTASEAGIFSALTPVLTLLMAMIVLGERNTIGQITGVIISLGGVCYIFAMNGTSIHAESIWGNFLVILSVLSVVLYYVYGRKVVRDYRPVDVTFVMIMAGCIFFNVVALTVHWAEGTLGEFFTPLTDHSFLLSILYLGVLSSLVTSVFNNYALRLIPASQVAIINNLTPIISIVGGIWILGEELSYYHYIGAVLVLIGVVATNVFAHRE